MHGYPKVAMVFAFMSCLSAQAQTTSFENAEAYVKSVPGVLSNMTKVASGDLAGDGTESLAILIVTQSNADLYQQLFVLAKNKAGQFFVVESSQKIVCGTIDSKPNCFVDDMYVKDQSFYVKGVLSGQCASMQATHQFKFYKGEWRLIGKKTTEYWLRCSSSGDRWQETDVNLLTNSSISSHKTEQEPLRTYKGKYAPSKYLLKDYPFNIAFGEG